MGVRFVIGRAGSGKSHHCLEEVRARLRADPIHGPRLILLVPEQAGLQTERAIIEPDDIGAAHRADVLSFRRLAFRIMESACVPARRALSEPARAMVLQHLITRHAADLKYYRRVERLTGFFDQLGATITELIQGHVAPDELAVVAQAENVTPSRQAKLHDLGLIYGAYLAYLGTDRVDPSQYLQIARELIPRCEWLAGAEVWVDGFASLMRQETLTLVALARAARHVDMTALVDPAICRSHSTAVAPDATSLFRKTRQTWHDLARAFSDDAIAVEDALCLAPKSPPRFRSAPGLARLERSLCDGPPPDKADGAAAPTDIELVELPSRRLEVDYAVSRIMHWVRDPASNFRYRDIAVIARDLEPYHDLLAVALQRCEIPFFIDRRRSVTHHPLPAFLHAAARVAADSMSLDSVRQMLKTGLLPISVDAADELENYLIAFGLEGIKTWTGRDWCATQRRSFTESDAQLGEKQRAQLERINATRRAVLTCFEPWLQFATAPQGHPGAGWAAGVADLLDRLGADGTIEHWATEAEQDGDLDQAAEHRQVWRDTIAFIDDMAFAFSGDEESRLDAEEATRLIETGLAHLSLGLAPPMVDQVLVGSIERSRHPDIKAAVLIGFNDGMFPKQHNEDSVLHDDDRSFIRECGLEVQPPSRERVFDEPLLVYIATTRTSDRLTITHASADNEGKALRPSPFLATLKQACPGLEVASVADPVQSRTMWDIVCHGDLTRRLVAELRTRPPLSADNDDARRKWNELWTLSSARLTRDAASRRALTFLGDPAKALISREAVERLHRGTLRVSVSQLETYAACPFQHFGKYVLRLMERAEASVAQVDVGQVHHAVLEDFARELATNRNGFAQLSDAELAEKLQRSCDRVAAVVPVQRISSSARDAYLLRRSSRHLARVIQAQRSVTGAGVTRPRAAELPFGFDRKDSLPALRLATPNGREIDLRGFIDRVDLAELADETLGIVIDYKRTRQKRLDLTTVYHGLSLQLLGYLLVLAEHGHSLAGRPIKPAAALYLSLKPTREVVKHPAELSERSAALPGGYRPRGLIRAGGLGGLDPHGNPAGWSDHYPIYRKKDGSLGQLDSCDTADDASFQSLLEHTRYKLGQLADGVLDGDVAVRPYRLGTFSPCSWCVLGGVCRFEMGVCETRFLDRLKRTEIFTRLTSGPGHSTGSDSVRAD